MLPTGMLTGSESCIDLFTKDYLKNIRESNKGFCSREYCPICIDNLTQIFFKMIWSLDSNRMSMLLKTFGGYGQFEKDFPRKAKDNIELETINRIGMAIYYMYFNSRYLQLLNYEDIFDEKLEMNHMHLKINGTCRGCLEYVCECSETEEFQRLLEEDSSEED